MVVQSEASLASHSPVWEKMVKLSNNLQSLQSRYIAHDKRWTPAAPAVWNRSQRTLDKETVLKMMKWRPENIRRTMCYAAEKGLCNDREVMMAAVRVGGHVLDMADRELLNDRELVLAAVQQEPSVIGILPEKMRSDKGVMLAAMQDPLCALNYLRHDEDDKDVVLMAVKADGSLLQCASAALCDDREVVMAAVSAPTRDAPAWDTLSYASASLRADRGVVLAAAEASGGLAFSHASADLLLDPIFQEMVRPHLEGLLVLKVVMLSGRSLLSIWSLDECHQYAKFDVVEDCKTRLDVPAAEIFLPDGSPLPDGLICDWKLEPGHLHEVQLIACST
mmetsp:Transcript_52405/g.125187  ORF Transcript_52405/g.125187 Transcript_52405/m.125187 type:complete len:335 (+) Transcript_52405:56-1060(+)